MSTTRRRFPASAALLLLAALARPVAAQPLITVPPTVTHRLASRAVGDSFEIRVMLPPMITGDTTRFPVVYMTDTHSGFMLNEDGLRLLMMGDVPRFIAVGIGYPSAQIGRAHV